MKSVRRLGALLLVILVAGCADSTPRALIITIHVCPGPGEDLSRSSFEIEGLEGPVLRAIAASPPPPESSAPYLLVTRDGGHVLEPEHGPPLDGTISIDGNTLRFTPRYPLDLGQRYRIVFDSSQLPKKPTAPHSPITAIFQLRPSAEAVDGQ